MLTIDSPPFGKRERPPWPSELDLIYNPSLGAYLIWHAALGYFEEDGCAMPLPLAFLVLPLVLHQQSRDIGMSTYKTSGLTLFAGKLGEHQEDLLAVHSRMIALKHLSLNSVTLASAVRLVVVAPKSAEVLAQAIKPSLASKESIRRMGDLSGKFGAWFARLPIEQVATTLRVSF